jgi:tetratricopeptide (TPR) repeat protein
MESDSSPGPRLSVAIIVRNAAGPLATTIAAVRALADEIVVLDTGSTDDTIVVALEAGAVVHRRPWDDSFAAARNACLEKLTGDWVLWLDAGEVVAPNQKANLRGLLTKNSTADRVFTLNVVMPVASGQLGREEVARVRLQPNRPELRFAGRIRESLSASLAKSGLQIDSLPLSIERGPLDLDPAVKASKAQRNIRLADIALAEQGPTALLHNVLGEAFQALGDGVRAAQHYRRSLELARRGTPEQLEAYYGLLTCLDEATSDRGDQLSLCMLALDQFPLDAQLLVACGGYLQTLDQTPLAVRAFDLAFRHGQTESSIWHLPEIREIAASCAAAAMLETGDDGQARTLLEAAVRTYPASGRLAMQLIDLLVGRCRRDEALAIVSQFASPAERQRLTAAVRGACLAQQGQWGKAVDLLQAAMLDGCQTTFCFRWLAAGWLELGRPRDAMSVLRAWQAIEERHPMLAELSEVAAAQLARSLRVDAADQGDSEATHARSAAPSALPARPART